MEVDGCFLLFFFYKRFKMFFFLLFGIRCIYVNQTFPDNAVRREMNNTMAVCVFPGCAWRGKFREYEAHEKQCELRQIAWCPLCGQAVTRGCMAEHRETQCPHRLVLCQYCNTELTHARLQAHLEVCGKFPLTCERCGQTDIPRDQMGDHLEKQCPKRLILCPMGCADQIEVDKFGDHLHASIESHLAWSVQRMSLLEQKLESSGVTKHQPQQGLSQVKGEISSIEKKLASLERQLKQLSQSKNSASTSSEASQDASRAEGATSQQDKTAKMSSELAAKTSLRLIEPIIAVLQNEIDKVLHTLQVWQVDCCKI